MIRSAVCSVITPPDPSTCTSWSKHLHLPIQALEAPSQWNSSSIKDLDLLNNTLSEWIWSNRHVVTPLECCRPLLIQCMCSENMLAPDQKNMWQDSIVVSWEKGKTDKSITYVNTLLWATKCYVWSPMSRRSVGRGMKPLKANISPYNKLHLLYQQTYVKQQAFCSCKLAT